MNDYHLSEAGADLIKHFESCLKKSGVDSFVPYKCPAGVLTIGWGHTNHHGQQFDAGTTWTQAQCDQVFQEDMKQFEDDVRRLVKVELQQFQFDALVSFTYNCGAGNLAKSTLLKRVNAKDFAGAVKEFPKWNKGGGKELAGLTRRRACEALMFQNIPDRNYDGKPDVKVKTKHGDAPPPVEMRIEESHITPDTFVEAVKKRRAARKAKPKRKPRKIKRRTR